MSGMESFSQQIAEARMALKTVIAASALTLLAAGTAQSQERIKFQYWYGLTGALGDVMQEHCTEFNKAQTKFEAVCTGQGGYDKAEQNAIAAYRAGQQPTILQLYDAGTLTFMLSDAVVPAIELAKEYNMKIDWNDYIPGIKSYFSTSKGDLWSFPYNHSTAVFYWNKDEWAKIGKTEPPQTWEEFEKDALALKEKGVGCVIASSYDTWQMLEQFSAMHDLPIASLDNGYGGLSAELVFNTTKFVDHVKKYKKWFDAKVLQIHTQQTGKTIEQAFADGTCASMLSSIANFKTINSTKKEGMNWGVALMPVYEGTARKNSLVGGAQLWVMKGKSKEEYEGAAAFLDWVTSPEQQRWMNEKTGYIPLTMAGVKALEESGFYKDPANAGREVANASLSIAEPTPNSRGIRLGNFTSIRAELRTEIEAVFTQNKDVQVAIDSAVERGNQILRRYEQTYQGRSLP
jgi:sn-glycerol 3-phosphate transport system substrate-binding protein